MAILPTAVTDNLIPDNAIVSAIFATALYTSVGFLAYSLQRRLSNVKSLVCEMKDLIPVERGGDDVTV